ncbi:MAG: MBL fold metallo-hydrolase [Thermoleophilia bacterium]|nr:MBL fold metallo-hydrolase [Thermoleophilia bacterium]
MEITPLASGSSGNAYRVDCAGRFILLECGLRFPEIQRGLEFNVSGLDGCLISHEHADHSKAVKQMMKTGVDLYMSAGTREALGVEGHRVHVMTPKVGNGINPYWFVMPFETQHDAAEPLGFLIARAGRKLLYASDTFYLKYRFEGLTHIMIECNYAGDILAENVKAGEVHPTLRRRIARSHMSLETVKQMLLANDLSHVRQIWLLHLSDGNSDAERFKREIQETTGKVVRVA